MRIRALEKAGGLGLLHSRTLRLKSPYTILSDGRDSLRNRGIIGK